MDIDLVIKALSNVHRRRVLRWLAAPRSHFPLPADRDQKGVSGTQLFEKSDLAQPTMSQYLMLMEQAGLITRTRAGRQTIFARNEDGIRRAEMALAATLAGRGEG